MSVSDSSAGALNSRLDASAGFGSAQVILRPKKSLPFHARHPWVFDSAIDRIEGTPADGDVVDLISDKSRFIARGIINHHSRLRVRLYTWSPGQPLDQTFWRTRLQQAIELRRELGRMQPHTACRLVFSEADGLSGLVVDRYDDYLVLQLNSLAFGVRRQEIATILWDLVRPRGILVRSEKGIAKEEGMESADGLIMGELPQGPVFITDHGLRYGIDLQVGHKTGGYLDQTDNRVAAAQYLKGRRVLDVFCYTGGFALAASQHGAREVIGMDSSERAIGLARANAELNGISNVHFRQQDCFDGLSELQSSGERFGGVILDPPKFTRHRRNLDEALRAYHRINRLAAELLQPGGILVTCSCSGSVTREDFADMLAIVAQKSGREIQVLEQRGASPDHPISISCPESEYLKCFICRVV